MLSSLIAPIIGIVVAQSTSISIDGIAKQLIPTDLAAVPGFAIKLGVAVVGGIAASKLAGYVIANVESVIETVNKTESEEVEPAIPADD